MFDAQIFDMEFLIGRSFKRRVESGDTKVNDVLYSLVQGSSRSITGKGAAKMPSLECIYFICSHSVSMYQCACCRHADIIHMISFVATLRPL